MSQFSALYEVNIEASDIDEATDLAMRVQDQIRSAWQGGGIQPVSRVVDATCTSIEMDWDDDDDDADGEDNRGNR